ncbi:hypothetical protein BC829DRAFT_269440 [Chytridium lagenaria]|nr:hypothetical protein BC829DRAFT_269440 [Chytridium lagenaria]
MRRCVARLSGWMQVLPREILEVVMRPERLLDPGSLYHLKRGGGEGRGGVGEFDFFSLRFPGVEVEEGFGEEEREVEGERVGVLPTEGVVEASVVKERRRRRRRKRLRLFTPPMLPEPRNVETGLLAGFPLKFCLSVYLYHAGVCVAMLPQILGERFMEVLDPEALRGGGGKNGKQGKMGEVFDFMNRGFTESAAASFPADAVSRSFGSLSNSTPSLDGVSPPLPVDGVPPPVPFPAPPPSLTSAGNDVGRSFKLASQDVDRTRRKTRLKRKSIYAKPDGRHVERAVESATCMARMSRVLLGSEHHRDPGDLHPMVGYCVALGNRTLAYAEVLVREEEEEEEEERGGGGGDEEGEEGDEDDDEGWRSVREWRLVNTELATRMVKVWGIIKSYGVFQVETLMQKW